MTLEEFYNKNKEHIVAIYQAGSTTLGIESQHDVDYDVYCYDASHCRAIVGDIEWLKRSAGGKMDVFVHYLGEEHRPKFWSVHLHYQKLLFGEPVALYQVLEHREEQTALLKRLVNVAKGKVWASVYVLAVVLQRNDYTLSDEDYAIVKEIYSNHDATSEQKAAMAAIANSL